MTKRNFLLLLVLLLGVLAYSQPPVTLRAFKQPVLPGTVPVGVSPNTPPSSQIGKRLSTNYYLYLIYPKSTAIQPQQVWIKGKAYKLSVDPVASTPVEHVNRNIPTRPVTTVLVPKTSSKVARLVPVSLLEAATPPATVKKLMQTSELVVSYKWKGKTYYKTVKKITELEPEMAE